MVKSMLPLMQHNSGGFKSQIQGPNPFSLLLAVMASLYKQLEFWKVADMKSPSSRPRRSLLSLLVTRVAVVPGSGSSQCNIPLMRITQATLHILKQTMLLMASSMEPLMVLRCRLSPHLLHLLPPLGTLLEASSSRIIGRPRVLAGLVACTVTGLGTQCAL